MLHEFVFVIVPLPLPCRHLHIGRRSLEALGHHAGMRRITITLGPDLGRKKRMLRALAAQAGRESVDMAYVRAHPLESLREALSQQFRKTVRGRVAPDEVMARYSPS